MTTRLRPACVVLATLAACAALNATAKPLVFNGSDQYANLTVPPASTDPNAPNSASERSRFLAALKPGSAKVEGFEGGRFLSRQLAPLDLTFSGGTNIGANLVMGQGAQDDAGKVNDFLGDDTGIPGRFNTSAGGQFYWESSDNFDITFNEAVSAFGFYGSDFFDFGGSLALEFLNCSTQQDGSTTCTRVDRQTVEATSPPSTTLPTAKVGVNEIDPDNPDNGSLTFYGFIADDADANKRFNTVRFVIGQSNDGEGLDYLGFDDFVVGNIATPPGPLPEPATLALVGVSLFGLAATRRRARR